MSTVLARCTLSDLLFPARDVSFARLMEQLSVPETGPPADNLVSNEDSYPRICAEIQERVPKSGVYLGVGPDQNFTYIAHAQPRLAFIIDYRRRNCLLHLLHKALFLLSPDRIAYLNRLTGRTFVGVQTDITSRELVDRYQAQPFDRYQFEQANAEVVRVLEPFNIVEDDEWPAIATIQAKLAGPGMSAKFLALAMYPTVGLLIQTTDSKDHLSHFISEEMLYKRVYDLHSSDCIVPLIGDFVDNVTLPRLARWLRRHQLTVSLLYISDVEFFILRAGCFPTYVDNLSQLPWSPEAQIARTSTREITHAARVVGDHSTTILQPVGPFLEAAHAGRIASPDELFTY